MDVDVLFDPFGGTWPDLVEAARLAEAAGFAGAWTYDHLAGGVHRTHRVLECWTVLTAVAVAAPGLMVGPLVLNVANRDAAMVAVMAATLQEVTTGRLLLGVGAGGGTDTPYAAEQIALGRTVPGAAARRRAVEAMIVRLREVWSGTVGGVSGFLRPEPPPPVILGAFGPKMAEVAGRLGDGINAPGGRGFDALVTIARRAHEVSGGDPAAFVVTASGGSSPSDHDRLMALGVDRMIVGVRPPYTDAVRRAADALHAR